MRKTRKVQALPQLVDALTAGSRELYLFFVDLCGSTKYKQNCKVQLQPDINWILRQKFFLQRSADLVKKYGGTIVKTIGDELFAFFEREHDPQLVLKCAIEIVQAFENVKAYQGDSKLEAKISIDLGETFDGSILGAVSYDPIGSAVDRCSRLNEIAERNQIIFSTDFGRALRGNKSQRVLERRYGVQTERRDLQGLGETTYYTISAE